MLVLLNGEKRGGLHPAAHVQTQVMVITGNLNDESLSS